MPAPIRYDKGTSIPNQFTQLAATGATVTSDTPCPPGCRGLLVKVAGNLIVEMADGVAIEIAVVAGINWGAFAQVNDSSGATGPATGVWAIT